MSSTDFAWLVAHGPEIFEKYSGLWIAVHDGKVIGVGKTAPEAAEKARETDPDGEFILEAVDDEADVIYAGLERNVQPHVDELGQRRMIGFCTRSRLVPTIAA